MGTHLSGIEGRRCLPVRIKLLLTIWTLENLESFRGIGDRFGVQMGMLLV